MRRRQHDHKADDEVDGERKKKYIMMTMIMKKDEMYS